MLRGVVCLLGTLGGLERMVFFPPVFSHDTDELTQFHFSPLSDRATGTCREWCFQSFLLAEFQAFWP